MYGRHHTEEARDKISKFQKGRQDPEETKEKKRQNLLKNNPAKRQEVKEKMSENHADFSGGKNGKARKVVCLETQKVYESLSIAEKETGIKKGSISANITGRTKSAHGCHWKYYEDYLKEEESLNESKDFKP